MTTNLKEDTLFIKSYQRASHTAEKPFVDSRLPCHLKELTSIQRASATTKLVTTQLSHHQQPKRCVSSESSVASCLLSVKKYF
ncbi:hypothetical protein ACRRTK_019071 [Alexandromys fortis]